jgi:hypothetical protein
MKRRRAFRARRQLLPRTFRSPGERREHLVSFGLVALLQAGIAAAMAVCAAQTWRMWRRGLAYLPGEIRGVIPVLLLLGAAFAGAAALRTLRNIRAARRTAVSAGAGDGEAGA